jgi:predicted ribonuclease YlaK
VSLVSGAHQYGIKARALGIAAEDTNDKVLEDTELLYPGCRAARRSGSATARDGAGSTGHTYYRLTGPLVRRS